MRVFSGGFEVCRLVHESIEKPRFFLNLFVWWPFGVFMAVAIVVAVAVAVAVVVAVAVAGHVGFLWACGSLLDSWASIGLVGFLWPCGSLEAYRVIQENQGLRSFGAVGGPDDDMNFGRPNKSLKKRRVFDVLLCRPSS